MRNSLNDDAYCIVKNCSNAKDIWDTLCAYYAINDICESKSVHRKHEKAQQYENYEMCSILSDGNLTQGSKDGKENITEYSQEICNTPILYWNNKNHLLKNSRSSVEKFDINFKVTVNHT
ncbi:MAG: hypothetical protein Q8877_03105 [Sweet potato little leaf phytoplasma]|nr:hypothetical protein [Sweet potato little leaf phytoplasma]